MRVGKNKAFIDKLYSAAGFVPDPTEELEGYLGEGGFAIIEFTFREGNE
jgi:hypothetical protein